MLPERGFGTEKEEKDGEGEGCRSRDEKNDFVSSFCRLCANGPTRGSHYAITIFLYRF